MKIGTENLIAELKFRGNIGEVREIIEKLRSERREEKGDLKEAMQEFLANAFGKIDNFDDTRFIFTQQDIADILDDFTDYAMGITWKELQEKDKKRRMARMAQNPPRRELY